jgi:hypothetical protein
MVALFPVVVGPLINTQDAIVSYILLLNVSAQYTEKEYL